MLTARVARCIAAQYADTRTPTGQTFRAYSQGMRVPQSVLADAVEHELSQDPASTDLQALLDHVWR